MVYEVKHLIDSKITCHQENNILYSIQFLLTYHLLNVEFRKAPYLGHYYFWYMSKKNENQTDINKSNQIKSKYDQYESPKETSNRWKNIIIRFSDPENPYI